MTTEHKTDLINALGNEKADLINCIDKSKKEIIFWVVGVGLLQLALYILS